MYEIEIHFSTNDIADVTNAHVALDESGLEYTFNLTKKITLVDQVKIDHEHYLRQRSEPTITEDILGETILGIHVGMKVSAVLDGTDSPVPNSAGTIMFLNTKEEMALVQFNSEECSVGYIPNEADFVMNKDLALDRKVTFKEFRRLVR